MHRPALSQPIARPKTTAAAIKPAEKILGKATWKATLLVDEYCRETSEFRQ